MNKIEAKKMTLNLHSEGYTVYYITEAVGKSKTTIYRYLQEDYEENRFPELEKQIKNVLLCGVFKAFVENLSYKDIFV